jgi:SAM-dependent methyltransferase
VIGRNKDDQSLEVGGTQVKPPVAEERQTTVDYERRLLSERASFSGCQSHQELPAIFNYWSNRYLRPKLESLGYSTPEEVFCRHFERAYKAGNGADRAFVSLGSGSCATEIRIAKFLLERNCRDFTIECLEMNENLLADARSMSASAGVDAFVKPVRGDFNEWSPSKSYDGVLANNSLHHVTNLEGLFGAVQRSLLPTGSFVTSDMIGRNGHMRWPEALAIVHEFWPELSEAQTYNHLLRRHEQVYENWDCSSEGFEGIRAQDILPLLIAYFEFDVFVPFANVVDPFIERTFGPNFDVSNPRDLSFVDRVHARDEAEIASGRIKPTHIVATMCSGRAGKERYIGGLTPGFSVRSPVRAPLATYSRSNAAPPHKRTDLPTHDSQVGSDELSDSSPRVDYSDLWWNPLDPGWGLSINQHHSGRLVAAWLAYRPDRTPIWYSLQSGGWKDSSMFEGTLYEANGPGFQNSADHEAPTLRPVGVATLTFHDHANGFFSYSVDGGSWSTNIRRMEY